MHVYRDRAQIPICRVDMFMAHEDLHDEERVDRLTLLLKTFEPSQQPASECRPQQMRRDLQAAGNACTTDDMLISVLANRQAPAGKEELCPPRPSSLTGGPPRPPAAFL